MLAFNMQDPDFQHHICKGTLFYLGHGNGAKAILNLCSKTTGMPCVL